MTEHKEMLTQLEAEFDTVFKKFETEREKWEIAGRKTLAQVYELGRLLTEIKQELPHGQFNQWVQDRGISTGTAYNWRNVYEKFKEEKEEIDPKCSMIEYLKLNEHSPSKALELDPGTEAIYEDLAKWEEQPEPDPEPDPDPGPDPGPDPDPKAERKHKPKMLLSTIEHVHQNVILCNRNVMLTHTQDKLFSIGLDSTKHRRAIEKLFQDIHKFDQDVQKIEQELGI